MHSPLEISFHGVAPSAALREAITERAASLERLAPDAIACHVTVEQEGARHRQGRLYRVHARLIVPGADLNAGRAPPDDTAHEDPYVAVRDTFDALRRRLEDHVRRRRAQVYHPVELLQGRIVRLSPDSGYGLIEAEDGREIRFHRNSLIDGGFEALAVGRAVHFTEAFSDDGPWASRLRLAEGRPAAV